LADYDGDGLIDLVSGSSCCQSTPGNACFYVFHRLKDGGFAPRRRVNLVFPTEQFYWGKFPINGLPSRIAVADLNGDGHPDLLIGGGSWDIVGVVYGPLAGKDELTVQRIWPKGQEPFPESTRMSTNPVLADWDGDGLPDLIVGVSAAQWAYSSRGVYWCRNVGTRRSPKFGAPQLLVADNGTWQTTGICVADWNGDGRPDLIASRVEYEVKPRDGSGLRYVPRHHKVWVYLRPNR
jgi:FG-GAP-like repeat